MGTPGARERHHVVTAVGPLKIELGVADDVISASCALNSPARRFWPRPTLLPSMDRRCTCLHADPDASQIYPHAAKTKKAANPLIDG